MSECPPPKASYNGNKASHLSRVQNSSVCDETSGYLSRKSDEPELYLCLSSELFFYLQWEESYSFMYKICCKKSDKPSVTRLFYRIC